jgi:hypothetical protein
MSTSLYIRLTAETHQAEGQFLQATLKREESLKLLGSTRTPVISNRDRQHLKNLNEHKQKKIMYKQDLSTEQGTRFQIFNKILLKNMVMSKETILTQGYMNSA